MIIRRPNKFNENSLLSIYRPCLPDELLGQSTTMNIVKNGLNTDKLQHSLLLVGPAGTGKTTAARIIAMGLNCKHTSKATATPCLECPACVDILKDRSMDVVEVNVGKESGKAAVDSIISRVEYAPLSLRNKVIIFDEAHKLSPAARDLLLKPLEDGISYVYYIFCTNQPDKLRSSDKEGGHPFIDRCAMLTFKLVKSSLILKTLEEICAFEGVAFQKDILKAIAEECGGVPRLAINWLEQVIIEGTWTSEAFTDITGSYFELDDGNIFKICQLLMKSRFKPALAEYDSIVNENKEGLRIAMAMFFTKCLKTATLPIEAERFSNVIDILKTPMYETGKVADMLMVHNFYRISRIFQG